MEGGDETPEHGEHGQGHLLVKEEEDGGGGEGGRILQTFLTGRLLRDGVWDQGAGGKGEGEGEEDDPSNHSQLRREQLLVMRPRKTNGGMENQNYNVAILMVDTWISVCG